jgi:hypothetical protein
MKILIESLLRRSGGTKVDLDGTVYPPAGAWDDLRFPATGINPPGAASDPARDTTDGALRFSASATNVIAVHAQLPHAWQEGSAIYPHVHWGKTSSASGNVLWRCQYKVASPGEAFPADWTTLDSSTTAISDSNTEEQHLITSFGPITLTGKLISTMVNFIISRVGGDPLDTYAAEAKLYEFDAHYLRDASGSGQQWVK